MPGSRPTEPSGIPHGVLSAVSHELRGPLGVARGYLRLLESQLDAGSPPRQPVEQAARALTRMTELLDELSEYARWARGELALVRGDVPLRHVVDDAIGAASLPATPRVGVEVEAPADVRVEADSQRLARALAALISAVARTATDDTTVIVAVRADDRHAEVTISRTGPREDAAEERAPTLSRAGAGLTVALADLIVHRHGGHLVERWVDGEWAGYRCQLRF